MEDIFIGFVKAGGCTVAKFQDDTGKTYVIDYKNCLSKMKTLKKSGYSYDQIKQAIDDWSEVEK